MPGVNLGAVDLNLLVALDALRTERSTTRAAARLRLTQPALSRALGRLRRLFDDPLLVRGPRGLLPTQRAVELADPVRRMLAEIERVVAHTPRFDPASAQRMFRLPMMERYAALDHVVILPRDLKDRGFADEALAKHGLARRIALRVPHFLVAPHVVASTDLMITLSERVARRFAALLPLVVVEPPLPLPRFSVHLIWHERQQSDPANAWLREVLAQLGAEA